MQKREVSIVIRQEVPNHFVRTTLQFLQKSGKSNINYLLSWYVCIVA